MIQHWENRMYLHTDMNSYNIKQICNFDSPSIFISLRFTLHVYFLGLTPPPPLCCKKMPSHAPTAWFLIYLTRNSNCHGSPIWFRGCLSTSLDILVSVSLSIYFSRFLSLCVCIYRHFLSLFLSPCLSLSLSIQYHYHTLSGTLFHTHTLSLSLKHTHNIPICFAAVCLSL